jgi:hypothetical protein
MVSRKYQDDDLRVQVAHAEKVKILVIALKPFKSQGNRM